LGQISLFLAKEGNAWLSKQGRGDHGWEEIPYWMKDHLGLVGKMHRSPVKSDEPTETVTLIPMGAARLRISALPVIGEGRSAHQWLEAPPAPPGPTIIQDGVKVNCSHCIDRDTVAALNDKRLPKNSNTLNHR
jgi:hypothetical protein